MEYSPRGRNSNCSNFTKKFFFLTFYLLLRIETRNIIFSSIKIKFDAFYISFSIAYLSIFSPITVPILALIIVFSTYLSFFLSFLILPLLAKFYITNIFDFTKSKKGIRRRKAIAFRSIDTSVDGRFHRETRSGRESQVTRRLTNLFISITQLQLYDIRQQLSSVERWKHTCTSNL